MADRLSAHFLEPCGEAGFAIGGEPAGAEFGGGFDADDPFGGERVAVAGGGRAGHGVAGDGDIDEAAGAGEGDFDGLLAGRDGGAGDFDLAREDAEPAEVGDGNAFVEIEAFLVVEGLLPGDGGGHFLLGGAFGFGGLALGAEGVHGAARGQPGDGENEQRDTDEGNGNQKQAAYEVGSHAAAEDGGEWPGWQGRAGARGGFSGKRPCGWGW